MGEIIKPVPAPGTTISTVATFANVTTITGTYSLTTAYGPTCNTYAPTGSQMFLLGISFNLVGSGPDIGNFIVDFTGPIFFNNTAVVSCTSDLPYSSGHYITGNIVTSGPDIGKLKISYETNSNAFVQIFIFGQNF